MYNLKFPREICNPKRYIVIDKAKFYKFINANISSSNIYTNVYNYDTFKLPYMCPVYESAIIDRIYFDCDQKIRKDGKEIDLPAYENMIKIHKWCLERDIMHFPRCTGSAYDVVIVVANPHSIKHKKSCVENAQRWLCKELDIEIDPQIIGDIARIHRVDNTFNHKPQTRRYCIPLDKDIIYTGEKNIFEVAKNQQFVEGVFGSKPWNISEFDKQNAMFRDVLPVVNTSINEDSFSDLSHNIPPCVKNLLARKDLVWRERCIVILALRDNCYLFDEMIAILKKYLSTKKYLHCIKEERQPHYLYKNEKYMFPNQDELLDMGVCPCPKGSFCDQAKHGCLNYGRNRK